MFRQSAMSTGKGYHHSATFAEGPRRPLSEKERAAIARRIEALGMQGDLTPLHERILRWILGRVGYDGRCDPSHEEIAIHTAASISAVQHAKRRAARLGLMVSTMRIMRVLGRVVQRTCAFMFPEPKPGNPPPPTVGKSARVPSRKDSKSSFLEGMDPKSPVVRALVKLNTAMAARPQGALNEGVAVEKVGKVVTRVAEAARSPRRPPTIWDLQREYPETIPKILSNPARPLLSEAMVKVPWTPGGPGIMRRIPAFWNKAEKAWTVRASNARGLADALFALVPRR